MFQQLINLNHKISKSELDSLIIKILLFRLQLNTYPDYLLIIILSADFR